MKEVWLIVHFTGIGLGVGVSFAQMTLGVSRSRMSREETGKHPFRSLNLTIMGDLGIIFMVVSGLFLMKPYWDGLFQEPVLMIKLGLVIALVAVYAIVRTNTLKALKNNGGPAMPIIKKAGPLTLPLSLAILVLAVLIFK